MSAVNGAILHDQQLGFVDVTQNLDEGSSASVNDRVAVNTATFLIDTEHHGKTLEIGYGGDGCVFMLPRYPADGFTVSITNAIKCGATNSFQVKRWEDSTSSADHKIQGVYVGSSGLAQVATGTPAAMISVGQTLEAHEAKLDFTFRHIKDETTGELAASNFVVSGYSNKAVS